MTDKGKKFAKDTFAYAQSHISGADPESYGIAFLKRRALKIQEEADEIDALKETMIEEAEKLPETTDCLRRFPESDHSRRPC